MQTKDVYRPTIATCVPGGKLHQVAERMEEALTARPDEDVFAVGRRMIDHGVRRLPVIGQDGEMIGMVSMRDLFALETLMADETEGDEDA